MTRPFKLASADTKEQWPFNKRAGDYSLPRTADPAAFLLSFTQGHELGWVLLLPPAEHHILNTQPQSVGLTRWQRSRQPGPGGAG